VGGEHCDVVEDISGAVFSEPDEDYREALRAIRCAVAAIGRLPIADSEELMHAQACLRETVGLLRSWKST
jgi:hypothetical protein